MDYQYFLKNNQQLYQLRQVLFLFFFVIFCSPSFKYNSEWIIETQNFGQALQSSLKEALIHYHGLGFTNIQNYLNLWKWKYQHKGLTPNQQTAVLYFNV
ncbi:hypothetical protein [Spiroplasma endosymbiont of Clivina fossor]|uniref:hypothetical protein n=1 Tax=Spiroplasma endosymbiont of Clivina fossor TaxID=3066282 RepID=UPI00313B9B4E